MGVFINFSYNFILFSLLREAHSTFKKIQSNETKDKIQYYKEKVTN